jgi:GT2 family glycosyltransferase
MLSIIIVNYKNEEKTISFVKNELSKVSIPHIIVIVNNEAYQSSNNKLVSELDAELITTIDTFIKSEKKCFVIAHPQNLGFARGNNLGVLFSMNHFNIDFLLFTNNDIRIIDGDVVEQLIMKIKRLNDVAVIGPKVIGTNKELQSPEPYITFWNRYFWMYWATPFLSKRIKTKIFKLNYSKKAQEGYHYKVMGSFFLANSGDFVKCEMMDPETFLYSEEVILSERLKNINKLVYYYPDVAVFHEHSASISQYYTSKSKVLMQYESDSYYYSRYKGISSFSIFLGRLSVLLHLYIMKFLK